MKRGWLLLACGAWALAGCVATARAESAPAAEAQLVGVVLDQSGQPVAGADVVVSRLDGSARRVAVTNAQGGFALAPGHFGPARLLVVSGRGARSREQQIEVVPGSWLAISVVEDAAGGLSVSDAAGAGGNQALPARDALAAHRQWDLASALVSLAGTAPATAPAAGPVIAGLTDAEIPVLFQGFRLNDPVTGAAPLELAPTLFGGGFVTDLAAPRLILTAPEVREDSVDVTVAGDAITAARGADGNNRPLGWGASGQAAGGAGSVGWGGRARGGLRFALDPGAWTGDPSSATALRGRRVGRTPGLLHGEVEAGGWQLRAFLLANRTVTDRGRSERVVGAGEPQGEEALFGLVGATARWQFRPGANDLQLSAGTLATRHRVTPAVVAPFEDSGRRISLASALRLGGELAGQHQLTLAATFDWENADRQGRAPGRQLSPAPTPATVRGIFAAVEVRERYAPARWLWLEGGLQAYVADDRTTATRPSGESLDRRYATRLSLAPRLALTVRPLAGGRTLALHAVAARSPTRLPLAAVVAAPTGERTNLPHPAEDTLSLGAELGTSLGDHAASFGLWAHARRAAAVVEDRFGTAAGELELFVPRRARRDYRALRASAVLDLAPFVLRGSAVLARLTGNHVGFVDEATGRLSPAGTGAFDGPDVEVNRTGRLPYDRAYGLRAEIDGHWAWSFLDLRASARARLDGGTPRSATVRSAASGEGQVFLAERGSVGRTRAVGAVDAGVQLRRRFRALTTSVALEGFNLTQHRPVTARDPRYSDGLTAASEPRPGFERPVAYAEPLLVRLLLGCAF